MHACVCVHVCARVRVCVCVFVRVRVFSFDTGDEKQPITNFDRTIVMVEVRVCVGKCVFNQHNNYTTITNTYKCRSDHCHG